MIDSLELCTSSSIFMCNPKWNSV